MHTRRAANMRFGLSAKAKMRKSWSSLATASKVAWRLIGGGTRMLVLTDTCELATGPDRALARCSTSLIRLLEARV